MRRVGMSATLDTVQRCLTHGASPTVAYEVGLAYLAGQREVTHLVSHGLSDGGAGALHDPEAGGARCSVGARCSRVSRFSMGAPGGRTALYELLKIRLEIAQAKDSGRLEPLQRLPHHHILSIFMKHPPRMHSTPTFISWSQKLHGGRPVRGQRRPSLRDAFLLLHPFSTEIPINSHLHRLRSLQVNHALHPRFDRLVPGAAARRALARGRIGLENVRSARP